MMVGGLEAALEEAMDLHGMLREDFRSATGKEFSSEGVALYVAMAEFKESKRGGAREKLDLTPEDKCALLSHFRAGALTHHLILPSCMFVQAETLP